MAGRVYEEKGIPNEKQFKILGVEFAYLCVMGIIFAFFGWVAENVVRVISLGIIDSRFHFLPFITPYALIPFAFHILLGSPDNLTFFGKPIFKNKPDKKSKILSDVIICLIICAVVFVSELAVGNLWDKVFGVKLWNYGNLPCHVTQYAGLIPSLGYGFGAFLLFKFFYAPVLKLIREKMPLKVAIIISATLGVAILADGLFLIGQIVFCGQANIWWSVSIW